MTTVGDIINLALKDIGVLAAGETADANDMADALATLNQMLGQWKVQKMYSTGQHQVSFPATGAQSYAVGPGATVDTPLPAAIDAAFWRLNNIDYPVTVLDSFEDYEGITLKTIPGGIPSVVYFQRNYQTGTLYVWPQPSTGTLNLVVRDTLPTYTGLADALAVPDEYALPLRYSLAELLLTNFGMPPRQDVSIQAAKARKVMKRNNFSISLLGQPQEVLGNGRFSIYSGQ